MARGATQTRVLPRLMRYTLANSSVDCRRHQVGIRRRDFPPIPALARWRLLPCTAEDKERTTSIEISQSTADVAVSLDGS
jgi:hypothetical protein